jgi:hypothetical protein
MNALESTKKKWIDFIVFPLKIYVVLFIPFYIFSCILYPQTLSKMGITEDAIQKLMLAFVLCGPILLAVSIVQFFKSSQKSAICTLSFGIIPTLVLLFILFFILIQRML